MDAKTIKQRLDTFQKALKAAGVKVTHQRMEIFREVLESAGHPDVETVFQKVRHRIPAVSLDTVYRTLRLLLDLGLITTLGSGRDRVRFDGNMQPHHHFVCAECGMAHDFYSPEFDQIKVPDVLKTFGSVERVRIECRGVCSVCMEARKKRKPNPLH